ncbi:hypothetical protein Cni_G18214 [Canna indica]|uniref:Transmembrane protein n=1 Tax=Canna indica TaxID=4628 RepID=A0AAQ3KP26_9LILI|nr:hypothetical protein Cni_G18214 [Canna indica]
MEEEASLDPSLVDADAFASASVKPPSGDANHGWQKVTYAKRHRRPQPPPASSFADHPNVLSDRSHVFDTLEQKALERRRAIESAAADLEAVVTRSRPVNAASNDEDDDSETEEPHGAHQNGAEAAKKVKEKKPKKPKVTVAEAAAKIDVADLGAFLVDISASYESQQDIQLMRFADYFGRSFASVSASQFPWTKMFKESSVSKVAEVPLCYISENIYKTSADWISEKSPEHVREFVLWCLDSILSDIGSEQVAAKSLKRHAQQTPPKAQVALFVVLAMTLRRKPDILISLLPKLRENPKYQGQEKLPVVVWAIAQASQGDLVIGMYIWAHYLFPVVCGKSNANPQSRDLILQLVERILAGPKSRPILLNGAVRKGERLVPPAALDLLMWNRFSAPTARIKATERFEAIYPTLKELALAGSPGTKTTKQASQQLLPLTVRAIQEGNPELVKEATNIFIWCLIQNVECYRQWEKFYQENVDASVAVLRKLANEWKYYSNKISSKSLRQTLERLRAKNKEALSEVDSISKQASFKDADKYCKVILRKLTSRAGCMMFGVLLILVIAVCLALSPRMELLAREKLGAVFDQFQNFSGFWNNL